MINAATATTTTTTTRAATVTTGGIELVGSTLFVIFWVVDIWITIINIGGNDELPPMRNAKNGAI